MCVAQRLQFGAVAQLDQGQTRNLMFDSCRIRAGCFLFLGFDFLPELSDSGVITLDGAKSCVSGAFGRVEVVIRCHATKRISFLFGNECFSLLSQGCQGCGDHRVMIGRCQLGFDVLLPKFETGVVGCNQASERGERSITEC